MERRPKSVSRSQPRRVGKRGGKAATATAPSTAPRFPNIEWLITGSGDITLGRMKPIGCVATAADEDICYAMLVRRPSESLLELLQRLDEAIALASEDLVPVDEVNAPSPHRSRRP